MGSSKYNILMIDLDDKILYSVWAIKIDKGLKENVILRSSYKLRSLNFSVLIFSRFNIGGHEATEIAILGWSPLPT